MGKLKPRLARHDNRSSDLILRLYRDAKGCLSQAPACECNALPGDTHLAHQRVVFDDSTFSFVPQLTQPISAFDTSVNAVWIAISFKNGGI